MFFKVDDDIYIKYDESTRSCEIISLKSLQELHEKLVSELPIKPTNKELIEWARLNYPGLDSIDDQQKRIDEVEGKIAELNKIK